jgi:hypothetical protein
MFDVCTHPKTWFMTLRLVGFLVLWYGDVAEILCSVAGCNHFWYSQHIANFILCHPAVAHVGQTNSYWVTCRGYGQEQGPPGSNVIVACRQIKWTKKDPARWNLCTSEMLIYIYIYIYIYDGNLLAHVSNQLLVLVRRLLQRTKASDQRTSHWPKTVYAANMKFQSCLREPLPVLTCSRAPHVGLINPGASPAYDSPMVIFGVQRIEVISGVHRIQRNS